MIGLLTIICNGNDYGAMALFGETHEDELKKFLELPHGIPSEDTFERVFARLNPKTLAAQFLSWIDELKGIVNVSIDGKTIRRSKGKGKKAKETYAIYRDLKKTKKPMLSKLMNNVHPSEKFYEDNRADIVLRETAKKYFDSLGISLSSEEAIPSGRFFPFFFGI